MNLVPAFDSPCSLADSLPPLLATFMDLERELGRTFREDTLTDLIIACFLQLPASDVVVRTPQEHRTGSDFDLALVDLVSNTSFQYRIQAKRLRSRSGNWKTSSYRELAHKHGTGSQVITLCKLANLPSSPPTVPLYAFYNPASLAIPAAVPGIALADAFEIEGIVTAALRAKPRPRFKRLAALQHLFFPLSDILCPPVLTADRRVATPRESRDSFERARAERVRSVFAVLKSHPLADVGKEVPLELRTALAAGESKRIQLAPVDRPQIVINASRPSDADI